MSTALRAVNPRQVTHHAVREFAQGVGWMAESGNAADVSALMERFGQALIQYSEKYAAATVRPKLPPWASSLLVGLAVALLVSLTGGLVTYGALQSRVTNLEARTSNIDRLNSLDAKVDLITGELQRMETRFNALIDDEAKRRQR